MGRPKGSLNKPKKNGGLFLTKFEKHIDNTPITKKSSQYDIVYWGQNNDYPNLLLNLYAESPTHHSACEFAISSIVGNGVDFEKMKLNGDEVVPNMSQTWDDVIKALATDYILFGSYALEVIMNNDGRTFSFYHIPMDKVRWSEYDEDGEIPSYWVCKDWTTVSQNPPVEIEALKLQNEEKLKKGVPYLYVYNTYSPTMTYYTQPSYAAAINSILSEIEFVQHDLKSATNNFVPSGMLVLQNVETDEERQAVINNVEKLFVGTNNSNSIMVTFRDNIEENKPEFIPFTANSGNVNLYADANERTINRVLCAHMIPSAALIGMPDLNNSGFSSEAQKLETAYQLYNKLTGNKNRMAIVRTLNQMFKLNGIETEIVMKPLNFADFGDDANVQERTESANITENDTAGQNEEKEDGSDSK